MLLDPTKMRLTKEGTLIVPDQFVEAEGIPTDGLVLNAPLYHPDLRGDTFYSMEDYRHLCTVTGAVWTPQGRSFGGDNQIAVAHHASLSLTTAATVLVWVMKTGEWVDSWASILMKGTANTAYQIRRSGATDNIIGELLIGGVLKTVTMLTNIANDVFYLVGFTYDGTTIQPYLNGVPGTPLVAAGSIGTNISPVILGRQYLHATRYWRGKEGKVLILNQTWGATEIQQFFLSTKWRYQ